MKCIECNENERVGYKYCLTCKKEVAARHNRDRQKRNRVSLKHLCESCWLVETTTTYCQPCSHAIGIARANGMRRPPKRKPSGDIDPKWLTRGKISTNKRGAYYA